MVTPRASTSNAGTRLGFDSLAGDPGELVVGPDINSAQLVDMFTAGRPTWHRLASCRTAGVDMFDTTRPGIAAALQVCGRCEARADCLADALERDERYGIWGGMDPAARRALKKRST
jgi:WhiB family transcriptional regulator, redox-sensing transcriptional regulator